MVPAGLILALMLLSNTLNDDVQLAVHRARLLLVQAIAKRMDLGEMKLEVHKNKLRNNNFPHLDVPSVCQTLPHQMLSPRFTSGSGRSDFWNLTHQCICEERNRLNQVRMFWSPTPEMFAGDANATAIVYRYIQNALRNWDSVLASFDGHIGSGPLVCNRIPSQPPLTELSNRERRDYYAVAESTQLLVDAQMRIVTFLIEELRDMTRG